MSMQTPHTACSDFSPLACKAGGHGPAVRKAVILSALLAALLMLFRLPALAQEGTIVGTVVDPSGAAVPNATVTIRNINTGLVRNVKTNSSGYYVAADLPVGNYTAGATARGFKQALHTGIVLTITQMLTVNFSLQLGATHQTVTVTSAPATAVVQTKTGAIGTLITGQQITKIATNGETFYNLLALIPGSTNKMPTFQIAASTPGNSSVSVNGQREAHNIFLLDGGEQDDRGGAGTMIVMPSEQSIGAFQVQTSNYSPQYGLSSAATVTMVTKSGANLFHAEGWEFNRNQAYDAINDGANSLSTLQMNVFGFNVGGPVALHEKGHHKTFFFYNMEWRHYNLANGVIHTAVPYTSTYGGVFPSTIPVADLHTPCSNDVDSAIASEFAADNLALSSCPTGGTPSYVPFPNNTIPTNLLSPDAQALLKTGIFPSPTSGQPAGSQPYYSYFNAPVAAPTAAKEELVRVDHQFTPKFSAFGHFIADQYTEGYATTVWSGDNVPTIGNDFETPSYSVVFHTTYTISPTLLNEAAFNYDGNRIHLIPLGIYAAPASFTNDRVFTGPNADNRIPSISLSDLMGTNYTANYLPWNNTANDYQVRDDLTWIKGSNQFEFGGGWALYKKVQQYFANTEGGYTFNGFFSGMDMADFLLGYANGYTEAADADSGHWNNQSPFVYANDDWHAMRRLTLNLGLRWDGIPHTYEADNQYSNFYPSMWNSADAATFLPNGSIDPTGPAAGALGPGGVPALSGYDFYLNGVGLSGHAGVPHGMVNGTWANFGPRIGFAYELDSSGKTVVRGGFGIMYERIQGNDMYDGALNPPWDASYNPSNVLLGNPGLDVQNGSVYSSSAAAVPVLSFTGLSDYYPPPRTYQYSLDVQRQLATGLMLSVAYVGNTDRYQSFYGNYELPPQTELPTLAASGGANWNTSVPYPGFSSIEMAEDGENAYYNSLQVQLRGQVRHDLSLGVAFTQSRSVDGNPDNANGGDLDSLYDPYSWGYTYGPSTYDRQTVLAVNFVYNLPFLMHNANHLLRSGLGGWELSGVMTAETGFPLGLTLGGPYSSNGLYGGVSGTNLPNFTGSFTYPKTDGAWFSKSAFSAPTPGVWGDMPYNVGWGPGYKDWDLSLYKEFYFNRERGSHLELRLETYNTFNSVNPDSLSTSLSSGNFSQVTAWNTPRVLQLGARLFF